MGVDFYGYSRVRTEPIPNEFRTTRQKLSQEERADIEKSIKEAKPGLKTILLNMLGASYASDGSLIIPDKVESDTDTADKFYEIYENEDDFLGVCWDTNTVYFKTSDTKISSTGISYSGYGNFRKELTKLNEGKPLQYMPPDIDIGPEYGFVSSDKCNMCLQGLNNVRKFFVSDDWIPSEVLISDINLNDDIQVLIEDNIHEELVL